MFAQIFRLLSIYSLIKPKKGSNVEGVNILSTMLHAEDFQEKKQESLCQLLDNIISNNHPAAEHIPTFLDKVKQHDYRVSSTPDFVQGFVAGYVAFRAQKLTKCTKCIQSVQNEQELSDEERFKMINICNRGRLQYPSDSLYTLTHSLENTILSVMAGGTLNRDSFLHILESIDGKQFPQIGCTEHQLTFTRCITSFYLITRAHFIAKRFNKINNMIKQKNQKAKKCRKDAKL